jgi:N6-L-threonylcarbamoyladenine synthase
MKILAIESSCDETAAAVVEGDGKNSRVKVLSDTVASSLDLHIQTGGIVPEVAAREQLKSMIPVIDEALKTAGIKLEDIDGIAVTKGPGLIGSLLVGVETAKSLSKSINKPLMPINHLMAHLFSNWIENENDLPAFPAMGLIVSGGHTDLIYFESVGKYSWIGGTRDDAAGECFDKCARILLDAPYPGGPAIAKAAGEVKTKGNELIKILPRPMIHEDSLEMSFSGLKTAVLHEVRGNSDNSLERKNVLAHDLQRAIVEILISKLAKALEKYAVKSILVGGGVVANKHFREQLKSLRKTANIPLFMPEIKYCSDNAVMVGAAALVSNVEALDPDGFFADPGLRF